MKTDFNRRERTARKGNSFYCWLIFFFIALRCGGASVPIEAMLPFFDDGAAGHDGGPGSFTLIAQTANGQDDGTAASNSVPIDTTGGKLAVASVARKDAGAMAFSDSAANTWVAAFSPVTNGAWPSNQMYFCTNFTASATHVFVLANGGSMSVQIFSCSGTPVYNGHVQAGYASGTTFQPGSLTPPSGTNLFVTGFGAVNGAFDIDSAFASPWGVDSQTFFGSGPLLWSMMSYKNSATAENPTWGNGTPAVGTASMLMFGMNSGGGGTCPADGSPNAVQPSTGFANFFDVNNDITYEGQLWQTNVPVHLCKVRVFLSKTSGSSISSVNFNVMIFAVDGSGNINTASPLATSDNVAGDNSWSGSDVIFPFSTPPALSANTDYAIVITGNGAVGTAQYIRTYRTTTRTITGRTTYYSAAGTGFNPADSSCWVCALYWY